MLNPKLELLVEGEGKNILLVPGLHSDLHEYGTFDDIAKRLVTQGYRVYRFSFSGSGQSGGSVYNLTLTRQIKELNEVIRQIPSDYGILASSFGAATVLAALPLKLNFLILLSGAYHQDKSIADLFVELGKFDLEGDSWIKTDYDSFTIGTQLWPDLKRYDLVEKAKLLVCPLLVLHGKNDSIAYRWAEEIYTVVTCPKKIFIHPEATHGIDAKPEWEEWMMVKIEDWLK